MVDNQIREDQLMSCIETIAKEAEEGREKMKEEIKTEIKVSKMRVMDEVETVKGAGKHLCSSTFVFVVDPLAADTEHTIIFYDSTHTAPSTDLAADLP